MDGNAPQSVLGGVGAAAKMPRDAMRNLARVVAHQQANERLARLVEEMKIIKAAYNLIVMQTAFCHRPGMRASSKITHRRRVWL